MGISKETSTIRISVKLKNELEKLGTVKDSYDSVIQRLLDFYKEKK